MITRWRLRLEEGAKLRDGDEEKLRALDEDASGHFGSALARRSISD
jgi:hypothetical protein